MKAQLKKKIDALTKDRHFFEVFSASALTFAAKIGAMLLGFVSTYVIATYYGAEGMGLYALFNAFFAFALVLGLLGMDTSILRYIPQYTVQHSRSAAFATLKKITRIVLTASLILSVLAYAASHTIAESIYRKEALEGVLALGAMFIVGNTLLQLNVNVMRALKNIKLFVGFQLLKPGMYIIVLSMMTFYSMDENNPVYALLVATALLFLLSFYVVRRLSGSVAAGCGEEKGPGYANLVSTSFPMFLSALIGLALTQVDVIMLGSFMETVDVGVYAVAAKFAMLTSFVLTSVNVIVAPKFAELYYSGEMDALRNVARKTSKMIFLSVIPVTSVLMLFGEYLLGVFGENFMQSYTALLILAFGQLVNAASGSVAKFLNMTNRQKVYYYIMMLTIVINVLLNLYLIPRYGINGAAVANTVSLTLSNVTSLVYIRRKFGFYMGYFPNLGYFIHFKRRDI